MRHSLQRFIAYGEDIIRRAERGDWDALMICGFANMTAVSIVVIALAVVFNLGQHRAYLAQLNVCLAAVKIARGTP